MADIEKVIKGLDCCLKQGRLGIDNCRELGCPYFENGLRLTCWLDVLMDAIKLIQDQQTRIITLIENVEYYLGFLNDNNRKVIVRCKDCKHRPLCEKQIGGKVADEDWFCADGERREADDIS